MGVERYTASVASGVDGAWVFVLGALRYAASSWSNDAADCAPRTCVVRHGTPSSTVSPVECKEPWVYLLPSNGRIIAVTRGGETPLKHPDILEHGVITPRRSDLRKNGRWVAAVVGEPGVMWLSFKMSKWRCRLVRKKHKGLLLLLNGNVILEEVVIRWNCRGKPRVRLFPCRSSFV